MVNTYPHPGSTEWHQRRQSIANAICYIEMSAGYTEYRLAMALLSGATGRHVTLIRTFKERLVAAFNAAKAEFNAKTRYIPPSAP
jgi:hypothetical protein